MTLSEDTDGYQFKNLPLTPAIIENLILDLFSGKLVERSVISKEVMDAHLARGGKKPRARNLDDSVKRALAKLKSHGLVENPSPGYWRIDPGATAHEPPLMPQTTDALSSPSCEESSNTGNLGGESLPDPVADLVIGSGDGAVYLYYLPTYRILAEKNGENVWPCKIGRTERDPLVRVLSQASTALPETPHVALIVRTQFPVAWESALHGVLTLRGLKIEQSPGSEWFLTSPDEVIELASLFDPSLSACADR